MRPLANFALASPPLRPRAQLHATPRILLVEDDPRQRLLLSTLLEKQGYLVEVVDTAASAIGAMHATFDLLVTDVDLGSRITGLDLVRLIRSSQPGLPVVMVSARDPQMFETDRGGPLLYLRKPCTSGALLAAVGMLAPVE